MRKLILTVFFSCWASVLSAEEVTIQGPKQVAVGQFVTLESSSQSENQEWAVLGLNSESYAVDSAKRKLFFAASKQGNYQFLLIVVSTDGTKISVKTASHLVVVGEGKPEPKPEPDKPDLKDVLSEWVRSQLENVPSEAVGYQTALADAFEKAAEIIEQNNLSEPKDISQATKKETQSAIPERSATCGKRDSSKLWNRN